ncbi:MAG: BatA domain-containing protein [Planctomycetaceae bacterium]|nr:BatA domain-containing protein [Planctomycetaceae bacterium]
MTFTTFSFFLGGLITAVIPVLLHLLMRGKPKRIEFPALLFVRKHLETYRRYYQLKHIILLIFRILILILLGLALSRPILKLADWFPGINISKDREGQQNFVSSLAVSLSSQDAPIAAAVVIDSSLRMEYVSENQSRFEAAKDFSRWILKQLPQGSNIAILSSDRERAVFQVDRLAAEEKINRLPITPLGRPITETVQEALILLSESEFEQRELYLLSDLSQPGWSESSAPLLQNLIEKMKPKNSFLRGTNKELGFFVIDISAEQPVNSSVEQFTLVPEVVTAHTPIRIDLELSHLGPAQKKTVELLFVDQEKPDHETVRASKSVDFSGGESRSLLSFLLSGFDSGTYQGQCRFTVPDALPIDDQARFTIHVQLPWKILLAAQAPVRDSSLYLRQALETVPFVVETISISDIAGLTATELNQYSSVILLDPSPLEPVVWKKLADYASLGHGVGVFLGRSADSLASFNTPSATEIIGAKLVRQARDPNGDTWIVPNNGGVSPIFSVFKPFGSLDAFPWNAQPVFRYWELNDFSSRVEVAASFSDGRAAILTQTIGRGRTVTVTTPVSEISNQQPWNQLTRGEAAWMFVLLSEGITKYLAGVSEQRYNFVTGEPVVLRPDLEMLPPTCLLRIPSGKSIRLTPDQVRREITVPATTESGNYRIRSGGSQESLDTGFSVNHPAGSTQLQKINKEKLNQIFGENNYRFAKTPQEVELGIARRRIGQELYAIIMLVLAFLFTGEYVFSNRFFQQKQEQKQKHEL